MALERAHSKTEVIQGDKEAMSGDAKSRTDLEAAGHFDGKKLRKIRETQGLTREDLEAQVKKLQKEGECKSLSAKTIEDLERGRSTNPRPATIRSLTVSLGISRADLFSAKLPDSHLKDDRDPEAEPQESLQVLPARRRKFVICGSFGLVFVGVLLAVVVVQLRGRATSEPDQKPTTPSQEGNQSRNRPRGVNKHRVFKGHEGKVWQVAFLSDAEQILSASEDGTVRWWSSATGEELKRVTRHHPGILSLAVAEDESRALSGGLDDVALLWNLEDGNVVRQFRGHGSKIWCIDWRSGSNQVVTSSEDGTMRVWDVTSGETVHVLRKHTGPVLSVAVSPNGQSAISCGADGLVCRWDLVVGEITHRYKKVREGWSWSVSVSPNGKLALVDDGESILVMNANDLRPVGRLVGHTDWIQRVLFLPDGSHCISCGRDSTVRLWDIPSGRQLACFRGHDGDVLGLAVSRDGRFALSGGADKTVRLWDLRSATGNSSPK